MNFICATYYEDPFVFYVSIVLLALIIASFTYIMVDSIRLNNRKKREKSKLYYRKTNNLRR